jgi:hypothetical protein
VFDAGVFHLELANLGTEPAVDVTCRFDPPLHDLAGRDVNTLALFARLPFLMPGKRIRTLLAPAATVFAAHERTVVTVSIRYVDWHGRQRKTRVVHDLAVYRDVAYTV